MRWIPSEGSGRYSPGPGMVELLEERSYQEIRFPVAICSQAPPGILAIDSKILRIFREWSRDGGLGRGAARGGGQAPPESPGRRAAGTTAAADQRSADRV